MHALFFIFTLIRQCFASYAALAAASSPLGVIGGALAGHGVATLASFFHCIK